MTQNRTHASALVIVVSSPAARTFRIARAANWAAPALCHEHRQPRNNPQAVFDAEMSGAIAPAHLAGVRRHALRIPTARVGVHSSAIAFLIIALIHALRFGARHSSSSSSMSSGISEIPFLRNGIYVSRIFASSVKHAKSISDSSPDSESESRDVPH